MLQQSMYYACLTIAIEVQNFEIVNGIQLPTGSVRELRT